MGRVVRSSRAVECVNSVVRMHQARHRRVNEGRLDLKNCQLKKLWCETIPLSVLLIRREAYAFQQAATPKFEVKRYGDPGYSNDGMAVSPGGYSASDFAGSASSLRGCLETKSLQDNTLCYVSGETKNGITGKSVSYRAFRN